METCRHEGIDLQLSLFGHFKALGVTGAEILRRRPRAQTLIAYLILADEEIPRAKIATDLWPETPLSQARTNLRRELHVLKTEVPQIANQIEITSTTLSWSQISEVKVDVLSFNFAFTTYKEASDVKTKNRLASKLLKLCTAPLLAETSEAWVQPFRRKYDKQINQITTFVVQQLVLEGNLEAASDLLSTQLAENALSESALILHIEILARQDKVPDAIEAYRNYKELLERELDTQPSRELVDLILSLKDRASATTANIPTTKNSRIHEITANLESLSLNNQNTSEFIGRSSSMSWLDATTRESINAHSELILVSGEAGIGKTRLIEEYFEKQSAAGVFRTVARCSNTGSQIPFATVASWLCDVDVSCFFNKLEVCYQEELERVFPDIFIAKRKSDLTVSASTGGFRGVSVLVSALIQLFSASAKNRIYFVEDMQWCDKDSLSFIERLLEAADGSICIMATLRIEDATVSESLQALMNRLESRDQLKKTILTPLSNTHSKQLLHQLYMRSQLPVFTDYQVSLICSRAQGNPLYLTEMVRYVEAGNSIELLLNEVRIPKKITSLLNQKFSSLSPDAMMLARTAAFSVQNSYSELIRIASGLDQEAAVVAFEQLADRYVMYESCDGRIVFNHELIGEALRQITSKARARFTHNKIALAYENMQQSISEDVAGLVADHYKWAGQAQDALRWYEQAMHIAEKRLAYHECLSLYQKASEHLNGTPKNEEMAERRADIIVRQAQVSGLMYGFAAESVKVFCRELEKIRPSLKNSEVILSLLNQLRKLASFSGDVEAALSFARQTVREAERIDDPVQLIEAYRSLGFSEYQNGHLSQAQGSIRRGVVIGLTGVKSGQFDAERMPGCFHIARYMEAHISYYRGRNDSCRKAIDHATSLSDSHISINTKLFSTLSHTFALYWMGDKAGVRENTKYFDYVSHEAKLPKADVFSLAFGGWADTSVSRGIEKIRNAIDQYALVVETHFMPFWRLFLAERQLEFNDGDSALKSVRQGLAEVSHHGAVYLMPELLRYEGLALHSMRQDFDLVLASFDQGLEFSRRQGSRMCNLRILVDKVKCCSYTLREEEGGGEIHSIKEDTLLELADEIHKVEKSGNSADLAKARSVLIQLK